MPTTGPSANLVRIETIGKAWKTLRPTKSFAGLTLAQSQTTVLQPCYDIRQTLTDLENQTKQALNRRDAIDEAAHQAALEVVAAVKGDKAEGGENGDLYEAMGYVRKSERLTGLTRKKSASAPAAK